MAYPRESSFMPTIKCSSCGNQVEISMMGEHVCGGPNTEPSPPLPPPPAARPDSVDSYDQPSLLDNKYGRMAPPTLDTSAANGPYMQNNQLTPISTSTGSISISPKTPNSQALGRPDDYFQPQIANDYGSNGHPRRPGGYGGFDDGDDYGADQMYPSEPKKQAPSLLQRMNTIAPGPFEMGKRPGARAAAKNAFAPMRKDSLTPEDNTADRPLTSASNNSFASTGSSNAGGIAPPKLPRKNGYGGFGPPGTTPTDEFEPEPFHSRAGTFPRPSEPAEAPARTPSAPGTRPDRLRAGEHERKISVGPDTSRAPPPRTSLLRPMTSGRDGAPPVDLASEFGASNPYHTPSASTSSGGSLFSHGRQASSQSSSQSSPVNPPRARRNPSDTTGFDNLMSDIETSMAAMQPTKVSQPAPQQTPADSYQNRRPQPSVDLRDDPAIQGGRPREKSPLGTSGYDSRGPVDRYDRVHERQPSDQRNMSSPPRNRREPVPQPPSRGNCKSCGDPIKGKSISSADGRLTGRYHKACFVCTTCREPFSSAEFYVLDDKPFCELHYHKLNGSLCGSCGRGIEGQYLEDEERIKHHVGCFRCGDCGMSLSNGYFEVNGKAYCERDAWRRVQPPPRRGSEQQGARGPPPGGLGLPGGQGRGGRRPSNGQSGMRPPVGLPRGQRMPPGAGLAAPMPRMNKRMTRLGMM
ncbi:Paxillin-like protein 1 [Colletotrichum chlorophyti]|uniref:Paxillin-like protein 1 n=1 Tax=Colletotrichum chlorophyti TaxID=708187 RepID=A0A1Q8RQ80_9PEZI|nr:Paxillin-like protein 1 [Colletotrichum chlorophyti]